MFFIFPNFDFNKINNLSLGFRIRKFHENNLFNIIYGYIFPIQIDKYSLNIIYIFFFKFNFK